MLQLLSRLHLRVSQENECLSLVMNIKILQRLKIVCVLLSVAYDEFLLLIQVGFHCCLVDIDEELFEEPSTHQPEQHVFTMTMILHFWSQSSRVRCLCLFPSTSTANLLHAFFWLSFLRNHQCGLQLVIWRVTHRSSRSLSCPLSPSLPSVPPSPLPLSVFPRIPLPTPSSRFTMLIKEYRIPMPMSVEEYRIAQLYMIQVRLQPHAGHPLHSQASGQKLYVI